MPQGTRGAEAHDAAAVLRTGPSAWYGPWVMCPATGARVTRCADVASWLDRLKAHACVLCACVCYNIHDTHSRGLHAIGGEQKVVVCPSKLNAGTQRAAGKPCTFAHACIYFLPFFFSSVPAALLWSAERHSNSQ